MLLGFLKKYQFQWFLAIGLLLAAAVVTLIVPYAFRGLIDSGLESSDVNKRFLFLFLLATILGILVSARFYMMSMLGERIVADLRKDIFHRIINYPPEFFESLKVGEVLSRLTTDTVLIQTLTGSSISIALRSFILLLGSLIMMLITSFKLAAIMLLLMSITLTPVVFFGKRVRTTSKDSQEKIADLSSHAGEILNGIFTVQAFVREKFEAERFDKVTESAFSSAKKRVLSRAFLTVLAVIFTFGGVVFVLWLGTQSVSQQEMSFGEFTQFVLYAAFMAASFAALAEIWGDLQRALGASERLGELFAFDNQLEEPRSKEDQSNVVSPVEIFDRVSFRDVSFSYPSNLDKNVLSNISFELQPGTVTALVGPSGAGKSTIFSLLLGFYQVSKGSVQIRDISIKELGYKQVRNSVSLVSQDPVIFSANAFDNIRYGRLTAADHDVILAAKAANAHDFISDLPDGYQSFLGEKGVRLSGGQKQRIAIARALLKNSPLLLLDEATSSLDSKSESEVQKGLDKLLPGRTSLIIAHRLSTVRRADLILVLDKGQIIERGNHNELMRNSGLYAHLASLQFEV